MTCISNILTILVTLNLILEFYNGFSLSLVTHDFMSIYRVASQRPQSGTTRNLMCKRQCTAISPRKPAFYGPRDLMEVVEVLFYFTYVWCLPRHDCPASTIWNLWELDVQNTTKFHTTNKARILWVGRPNNSDRYSILFRTILISASLWLSSVHNLELGTWCAKHNVLPFCL
jgi:hypothetical protein